MSLEEIADNSRTDKNTTHSYLPLYQKLLVSKKEEFKAIVMSYVESHYSKLK